MEALELRCVVDTSVWINLHNGKILPQALSLTNRGWEFYMTDEVARELEEPSYEILEQNRVKRYSLSDNQVIETDMLQKQASNLSVEDASSIVATQALKTVILTDEQPLRQKAQELQIEVHGTLWLLDQLVAAQLINDETVCDAIARMIAANAWFPKQEVNRLKTRYNCP
jgi:predicted nucleic acid-binding protein